MDKYGYIGIETLLNFCENSKDHSVTPNDFMRMKRVRMPERKTGHWILGGYDDMYYVCDQCGYRRSDYYAKPKAKYCENCGADMREGEQNGQT